MDDRARYWIDLADYDIDTAHGMLKIEKYLYVGFMCHQAIEKALKAVIARDCAEGEIPPKIHHLLKLAEKCGLISSMPEEQRNTIRKLNPLNIESRYPSYKEQISAILSPEKCREIIAETEALLCWIKKQL